MNGIQVPNKVAHVSGQAPTEKKRNNELIILSRTILFAEVLFDD